MLTPAQVAEFHEEGFTRLGRVLSDERLEAIRREEAMFRAARRIPEAEQGRTHFFSQIAAYAPAVRDLLQHGPQLDAVEQLIGPDLMVWFTQFVTKFPDGGLGRSEFPWHQDNGYASIEPATNVTVWIALDDVTEENGCVWVAPGSHRQGLLPHRSTSADSWFLTLDVPGDGIPVPMRAGEAVAFTGLTLHRSKFNHTDRPRRAFFMEYCDPNAAVLRKNDAGELVRTPITKVDNAWVVRGSARLPEGF